MTRLIVIVAAVVTVAVAGLGFFFLREDADDPFARCRSGQIAGGNAAIGGPFALVSETGDTVTEKEVIDQPALIYFGYTFCPDVCPVDMSRNALAVEVLEERGKIVKPVFISVDPKRDTPQVLADFTDNLHPRMLGLTGTADQIKAVARAYRAFYKVHDDGTDEYYLVDHSTLTYLMLPEIGFVEFFRRDVAPEEMADRIECLLDAR